MIENLFNISFKKIIQMILPRAINTTEISCYAQSLAHPLDEILPETADHVVYQLRRALFSGQKIVMQESLNYLMNTNENEIYIITVRASEGNTLYLYDEGSASQGYIYDEGSASQSYLYDETRIIPPGAYDFIVYAPQAKYTAAFDRQLRGNIDLMKPVGKSYELIYY